MLLWRSLEGAAGSARSIFAGVFTLAWVPFLISFALLSARSGGDPIGLWPDGVAARRLADRTLLLLVVSNDTFGYLVGASLGKHPMAPKISPKKSWEGFAGSIAGAMLVGVLCLPSSCWTSRGGSALVLAVGMVAAATAGDLAESMVKRELGIKDMSNILPGHGGVMDRLDSIVFASPVAYPAGLAAGAGSGVGAGMPRNRRSSDIDWAP